MKPCWQQLEQEISIVQELVEKQVEETPQPEGLGEEGPILVTGCGDSWAAALAAELSGFGRAVDPLDILASGIEGPGDLIALSVSGRSRKVVEVAKLLSSKGFRVIAVTGDEESPLARHATITVKLVYSKLACGVGAARHAVMLAALASLAGSKPVLTGLSEMIETILPLDPGVTYVGAGVGYSSALYTTLKTCELFAECASAWPLEQFAHAPVYGVGAGTLVLFPDPRLEDRLGEYIQVFQSAGFEVVKAPCAKDPWSTAISQVVAVIASMSYVARLKGIRVARYREHPMLEALTRLIYESP